MTQVNELLATIITPPMYEMKHRLEIFANVYVKNMNEILTNAPPKHESLHVNEISDTTIAPLKDEMKHMQEILANAPSEYGTKTIAPPGNEMKYTNEILAIAPPKFVRMPLHENETFTNAPTRYEISTHTLTMSKYEYEMVHRNVIFANAPLTSLR